MRLSFKIITVLIFVICGLFAWYLLREDGGSEFVWSNTARDTITANKEPSAPERDHEVESAGTTSSENIREFSRGLDSALPVERAGDAIEAADGNESIRSALRYEQPILSALEWGTAAQGGSDPSAVVRNAAMWMTICKSPNLVSQVHASEASERDRIASRLGAFCEGFSEDTQAEIDQFFQSKADRFSSGNNTHSELLQLSQTQGARTAVDHAIALMPAALERLNYGRVLELVWLAGAIPPISSGQGDPELKRALSDDAQVLFAVTALVYCRHLGDCRSNHPVVLLLCQQMWPDRKCSAPRDIHDAIDQLLTGAEYEEYLAMVDFITARIEGQD